MTAAEPQTRTITPKILYYGMPVILITTRNEDHTSNISPISSSFALGDNIILGISTSSKAYDNLTHHPECVINLPSAPLWENVERIAPYTGRTVVPEFKEAMGFTHEKDKFAAGGFTAADSEVVQPTRISECPIQIEAQVQRMTVPEYDPFFAIIETRAVRVHAHDDILIGEHHIDPRRWNPLIYNFRHYFGLGTQLGATFRSET
ncbi:flavin reductase (DIM6/NTAB) family NADH-FMN oxidoreductase RutF [Paenibacillus rhizosphaerae]|uniref:Flavin reductase (DIM6/NTAB) family NADH-FMN oxidoreductase RutF n=1 Tax=Paenibacillus rhizosphaerae TaxID=297318 RepID=A0A839TLJ5_9BACL|nr:flavin reductase family protein [Paenibacillus rhizosphaerae]MBB3126268.1 flavin reductase (DIM6/NTAB) family NADH-FMN oxidoreductase RutF [Paenibacillus rhizosphaerae]